MSVRTEESRRNPVLRGRVLGAAGQQDLVPKMPPPWVRLVQQVCRNSELYASLLDPHCYVL